MEQETPVVETVIKRPRAKTRILLACCTLTSIDAGPYMDHSRLYYRLGKEFPHIQFGQMFSKRMSIDRFRNMAGQIAHDSGFAYLMFIDDDMQFDYGIFKQLYKPKWDILAALNYIRGYPFDPMAFKYVQDIKSKKAMKQMLHLTDEEIDNANGGILKCDAVGTATCLIKVSTTFAKIQPPYFLTGPNNTEDIYFCIKAREYYKKIKIGVHTGAITGHRLDPEVISYYTRKKLQAYYESYMTPAEIEKIKGTGDRGKEYVESEILDMVNEPESPDSENGSVQNDQNT